MFVACAFAPRCLLFVITTPAACAFAVLFSLPPHITYGLPLFCSQLRETFSLNLDMPAWLSWTFSLRLCCTYHTTNAVRAPRTTRTRPPPLLRKAGVLGDCGARYRFFFVRLLL
jgi:hypothetical protein